MSNALEDQESHDNKMPVWQLTDGTVVIQSEEDPALAINRGRIKWTTDKGVARRKTFFETLKHSARKILEHI
ncbi:MAG: hypothetical protein Q8P73_01220 [bacterium]|nr:hypothetical protein [bacterium]